MKAKRNTDVTLTPQNAEVIAGDMVLSEVDGKVTSRQIASTDPHHNWAVVTTWEKMGGRLEPVSVTVMSADNPRAPVLGEILRRLPTGTLQRTARKNAAAFAAAIDGLPPDAPSLPSGPLKRLADATRDASGGHRGVVSSPDEIKELAAIYLAAWGNGEPVTSAVAEHFHISESTAGKRIMKARKAHLLDSARRITK